MKRMICLLVCLSLLVCCTGASAAHYETLAEKLSRQLEKGSGLKGAMTLTVEGEAAWAQLLQPLSGVDLSLRGIATEEGFEYSVFAGPDDGDRLGLTQIYGDAERAFLRSDLLIDSLFMLPIRGDLLSSVTAGANPTFYSAAMAISGVRSDDWADLWAPVLQPYLDHIDRWMTPYGAEPVVERVDGASQMVIVYDLPADALRAEMKALLGMALQDQQLLTLLKGVVTDEQLAAYLDPNFQWFYEAVIDALPLEGGVRLMHRVSAQGEMLATGMTFPLDGANGWDALTIDETETGRSVTLTGDRRSLTFTAEAIDADQWAGMFTYVPAEGEQVSFAYNLNRTSDYYTDEETRSHEVTDWQLTLRNAEDQVSTILLRVHYYSKPADTQATTLELALSAELPDGKLTFAGRFRSASPWQLDASLPREGATDLSAMSAADRMGVVTDLLANALALFDAEAADAATITDLPLPEGT